MRRHRPFVFVALTLLLTALFSSMPLSAVAQPPLSFDVASVKRSGPLDPQKLMSGQQRVGIKVSSGRVDIETVSVSDVLYLAFEMRPDVVIGPSWLGIANAGAVERFDIHATLPPGATSAQVREMLRSLLADRFKLVAHRERKDQNVFALVVGKNGPKLSPSAPDAPPAEAAPQTNRPDAVQVTGNQETGMVVRGGGAIGATRVTLRADGSMHLVADTFTMVQLAATVERFLDRPVIDLTEFKGTYTIALDLSRDDLNVAARAAGVTPSGAPGAGAADPAGTSVMQSIEQLGLKLDARRSPIEFLVIDRVERTPTED